VLGLILFAGAVKAFDVPQFEASLRTWAFIPDHIVFLVALAVPSLEVGLAMLWFLRLSRRIAPALAGLMLILFTSVFAAHVIARKPPNCGCFSAIDAYFVGVDRAKLVLWRNGTLIGVLLLSAVLLRPRTETALPSRSRTPFARGFTLIELLLVIALLAVLISLLLPSLRAVRNRGRSAVSLTNLRQHVAVMHLYSGTWRDQLPYFVDPSAALSVIRYGDNALTIPYFGAHAFWNYAMADDYYDGLYNHESFYPPSYPAGLPNASDVRSGPTPYYYGCSFIAHPSYWNPYTRQGSRAQWQSTRLSSVAWPARKVLLYSSYPSNLSLPDPAWRTPSVFAELGFVDAHASVTGLDKIRLGYSEGDGTTPGGMHFTDFPFSLHTLDGLRGFDLE
jgi:prepilin-type N-terminal cleavage/methylation domain-containing protein